MGLYPTDSIPRGMSQIDAYTRIWTWYTNQLAENESETFYGVEDYIQKMPKPKEATKEQMTQVFEDVIMGCLEWAYHQKDEHGYKIAAYAHAAVES